MRHRWQKAGPKLFICQRCHAEKQMTKPGLPSVYRKRSEAPWESEEPTCHDPYQADLFGYRPDDEGDEPRATGEEAPLASVTSIQSVGRNKKGGRPRLGPTTRRVDLSHRSEGELRDGRLGPEELVALTLSIFEGSKIIEHPVPVDFGEHHLVLELEPEILWEVSYVPPPQVHYSGLAVRIVGGPEKAERSAEVYVARARVIEGATVVLRCVDRDEVTARWRCVKGRFVRLGA